MTKQNKQIQALQLAARNKRKLTSEKVKKTLQEMQEKCLPISIGSVAKLAGVSREWIYNNAEIKDEVLRHRRNDEDRIQRIVDLQQLVSTRDKTIAHLKHRNQQQKTIIKKLRRQLEIVYGELYKANKK